MTDTKFQDGDLVTVDDQEATVVGVYNPKGPYGKVEYEVQFANGELDQYLESKLQEA